MPFSRYLRDWSMEDRSIVVAVTMDKAERCSGCGLTAQDFEDDPLAYEAVQVVCPWCAMKDRARDAEETDTSAPGASIKLLPSKIVEALRSMKAKRPASRRERARQQ